MFLVFLGGEGKTNLLEKEQLLYQKTWQIKIRHRYHKGLTKCLSGGKNQVLQSGCLMKYRTLWIKVQSHSVVKNLQQQRHTVLTMVTNLFLSLLIRLAIFSPCIALQYFLDDEFHMSCHSCAIPSLTSP